MFVDTGEWSPPDGTRVQAFDAAGRCVGEAEWPGAGVLVLREDDPVTPETDGLVAGEPFTVSVEGPDGNPVPVEMGLEDALLASPVEALYVRSALLRATLTPSQSVATGGGPSPEAISLTVAPNPASTSARVQLQLGAPAPVRIVVFDALGRHVVALTDERLGSGVHTVPLDVQAMAPGMYIVRVVAGEAVAALQFAVVR